MGFGMWVRDLGFGFRDWISGFWVLGFGFWVFGFGNFGSDRGSEFINEVVSKWLADNKIKQFATPAGLHLGPAERGVRIVKVIARKLEIPYGTALTLCPS